MATMAVATDGAPGARAAAPPFAWTVPPGLPVPAVPAENPMSAAKVALGRRLFYDLRLSGNGTYACATCHQQARAFTDGRPHAVGSTGGLHARSAMTLTNVAYNVTFGWADPGLTSLEAQISVPMFNEHPIELGLEGHEREVVGRFDDARDRADFAQAFPDDPAPVTLDHIVKSIAAFERTLLSGDSPFDRYLYRDWRDAMTPDALHGMQLFFSADLRCSECHSGFNLSGPARWEGSAEPAPVFHNTGLYDVDGKGGYPEIDRGLFDISGRPEDMGRFRAPTLRNVAVTAPYMHDGSIPTLDQAILHYASGGISSPFRSDRLRPLSLSPEDRRDLVRFLESLTDDGFLSNPAFGRP
jgi:cytochrome c peroxidase